jgi:hypothetical protein
VTEPSSSPAGENYVTLRVYFDGRIDNLEKLVNTRLEANALAVTAALRSNQMAIDKAEATVNERLQLMNEFRAAMKDQAAQYVTQSMLEARDARYEAENKTMWKFIYGLATAIAVIQAILQFTPGG